MGLKAAETKMAQKSDQSPFQPNTRPSRTEAEEAVRTLLRWAGDDPSREGLRETPARVARAFDEFFAGYAIDPADGLDDVLCLAHGAERTRPPGRGAAGPRVPPVRGRR